MTSLHIHNKEQDKLSWHRCRQRRTKIRTSCHDTPADREEQRSGQVVMTSLQTEKNKDQDNLSWGLINASQQSKQQDWFPCDLCIICLPYTMWHFPTMAWFETTEDYRKVAAPEDLEVISWLAVYLLHHGVDRSLQGTQVHVSAERPCKRVMSANISPWYLKCKNVYINLIKSFKNKNVCVDEWPNILEPAQELFLSQSKQWK